MSDDLREGERVVVLDSARAQCPRCKSWNTHVTWVEIGELPTGIPDLAPRMVECLDCPGESP